MPRISLGGEADGVGAIQVAEHIRWLRDQKAEPTTPMQILKLVYIAHGWVLGFLRRPLIRQPVEAWRYGPVVPTVYHHYKVFERHPIIMGTKSQKSELDEKQQAVVKAVEKSYRRFSGPQLSSMTHQKGSPWDITVQKQGLVNAVIPNDLIQQHYKEKIEGLT